MRQFSMCRCADELSTHNVCHSELVSESLIIALNLCKNFIYLQKTINTLNI